MHTLEIRPTYRKQVKRKINKLALVLRRDGVTLLHIMKILRDREVGEKEVCYAAVTNKLKHSEEDKG